MSEMIGYARVSSTSQNLDAQMDALHQAGCTKTFTDAASGTTASRPGWDALRAYLRPGDVLVITELSRMTRSLMHLLHLVQELEVRQVALQSLREHICNGLQSKRAGTAISAFSGPHYLHLSPTSGPDYLHLRLQSAASDCNPSPQAHIICN